MKGRIAAALVAMLIVPGLPAAAQNLIGSYVAYIGEADLYNSRGQRLDAPWQILRQDRANFHRYGISQPGDEWDPFFGNYDNRALMERMLRNGTMQKKARRRIMRGGSTVFVRIYGRGNRADYIQVTVPR